MEGNFVFNTKEVLKFVKKAKEESLKKKGKQKQKDRELMPQNEEEDIEGESEDELAIFRSDMYSSCHVFFRKFLPEPSGCSPALFLSPQAAR